MVERRERVRRIREMYETASVASVGFEFALAVILGGLFGHWLDTRLHSEPYLTLVFVGFGLAAGVRGLLRVAQRAAKAQPGQSTDTRAAAPAGQKNEACRVPGESNRGRNQT